MYSSITSTNGFAIHHYVFSLYAAVQFFTLAGLGDVPMIYLEDIGGAVICVLLLLNIFHTMYIIGEITGSFIEIDFVWFYRNVFL